MENLIFSLNATVPVFLMMVLGLVFRKLGWIDDVFASKMNKFVFLVPLPVLVFEDLATVDFSEVWNLKFVLFCFAATLISIGIAAAVSFLWRDKSIQGEFIQASYRSSAALLGIAFIQNIYGNAGLAPLMIIGSVPLYNVMAVIVLAFFRPERKRLDKELWKSTLKGIVTNPIIIGIAAGILWSALKIPMPPILEKTVSNVGAVATPLGLMAMGATFDIRKAFAKVRPAAAAAVMKLVGFAAVFLPLAVMLGFRREELVAILVMLGSATTVSCFVMAKNMGHEGVLTSSVVMLTTLFSAFTLTGWLYVLRSLGMV
ncbi:MAG TPA: AEC family transporter [Candidatus Mediterraneibacter tabaqchaliae]|uniref:AEC family transporter n=1 Tax=Candidatus Mediterraneibacter tabaqchaliae TaxID=2838689 RepID=A0A9D2U1X5_9FIRM|nr:AEC family transporter [Candidatus Mediterraneibacter tabaqchaliae]